MRKFVSIVMLLVVMLAALPVFGQDNPGTIVDIAVSNPDFSTLVAAVTAADLVETLSGEGPFTVFAPTNDAFAKALEAMGMTPEQVLGDADTLTQILLYHVVPGKVMAADVVGLSSATTAQGEDIAISVEGGKVMLNGSTAVVATDLEASNGVIHVIDNVLLPPSLTAAMSEPEATLHIRVAHFSPDTPAVDVYVNGEAAVEGLAFPTITDWIELPAGSYNLAVAPAGTSINDAAIGPADFDLPADAWLTIAAIGSLEAGTLAPSIIAEDYSEIAEGSARVTIFHAIEDAPAVDVLAGGSAVVRNLAYPGKAGSNDGVFTLDVPAGSYDLQVVPTGRTSPVVLDLPGTELTANVHYFVAAVGTLSAPQVALAATDMGMMMEEMSPAGTIVDIAVSNPDFSTLVAAVTAADLVETLSGEGPFTVFAPTNDAFAAALEALNVSAADLLGNKELLTQILTYHVIAGNVMAADVVGLNGKSAATVEGSDISISIKDGKVYLNDTIEVVMTDIAASNGVIHVINGVLLPPTN